MTEFGWIVVAILFALSGFKISFRIKRSFTPQAKESRRQKSIHKHMEKRYNK